MNANINKLLNEGEGISVEFKKAYSELPSNFFETVCAFLNRNGGSIILGVSDDRKTHKNYFHHFLLNPKFLHTTEKRSFMYLFPSRRRYTAAMGEFMTEVQMAILS